MFLFYLFCLDAHTHASLLKLWYRELYDPLIPDELYEECVQTDDPAEAAAIINRLPRLNRMVIIIIIFFLKLNYLFYVILGFNIFSAFSTTIFTAGCCCINKNGFSKFSNGFCAKLPSLYITRSKSNIRKC